jgi:KDO2-lipid IV(A) lauroyltransferase
LTWLAGGLPETWVRRLGRWLGWLAFSVLRIRRRVTLENLRLALDLPPGRRLRLARRIYHQLGAGSIEFLQIGRLTPRRARAALGGEQGLDRLREVLARGRGMLALGAHLGSWDLLACATARCGLPVNVVTRRIKTGWVNRFWMDQRRACGVRLLPAEGSAPQIRAALRRNEIVAMVLDQHEPGGLPLTFLGRPAATGTALARLARATGSPVVPVFLLREPRGFRMLVEDPLDLQPSSDRARDLAAFTRTFLGVIEDQVRQRPEQWLWLHRRWKI